METIKLSKQILFAFAFLLILFTSCKPDDKEDPKPDPDPITQPEENTLTAMAGADTTVEAGSVVQLNGSASKDSKNRPFTFQWTVITKPAGSNVNLNNLTVAKPTFTPDEVGEYVIELTIANEKHNSKDRVKINATVATPLVIDQNITVTTILLDRIADPNLPDYIVTKDVGVFAELTIQPGVVIAFDRNVRFSIEKDALIIAKGTAEKKIKFIGKEKTAGFWRGMIVYSYSNANIFEHTEFSHTGSNTILSAKKAALTLFGGNKSQISIKNSSFVNNEGYGMHVSYGSILREFSSNTFSKNTEAGILLSAEMVSQLDYQSQFTGENGRNVVEIMASNITDPNNQEVVWKGFADKSAYLVTGEMSVTTGWKIDPGVTIRMERNVRININSESYIIAEGTLQNKIVITGAISTPGYWRGMMIYSTSAMNSFRFVEISYGGSNTLVSGKKANLAVFGRDAILSIKDSQIKGCTGYGIFVSYTSKINSDVLTANEFIDNTEGAMINEN